MTVPLDRLYHYIENIAQDIRGDAVVIYRFTPHGSKKIDNLQQLKPCSSLEYFTRPHLYCNDQEPLDFDYYQDVDSSTHEDAVYRKTVPGLSYKGNLRLVTTLYKNALLLHSEERSENLIKYQTNNFIPVYYWSHAIIAREWFRYGEHITQRKNVKKTFLIYNRAWSGSREYRLKLADLLVTNNLHLQCQMAFNPIEPELGMHYSDCAISSKWRPNHKLEDYFEKNKAPSYASADFDIDDYNHTDFEVVLETLYDNERIQLTEKSLRPIALGQPFLFVAPHGTLEYLKRYGFKTFDSIIDETYDTIEDPVQRLNAVIKVMTDISAWTSDTRINKLNQVKDIVDYNRKHFYSNEFFDIVVNELKTNLKEGLTKLDEINPVSPESINQLYKKAKLY